MSLPRPLVVGTGALRLDYSRWRGDCGHTDTLSRDAFEEAGKDQGFDAANGLAYGLVLKSEVAVFELLHRSREDG
jgi:hypothetical protein